MSHGSGAPACHQDITCATSKSGVWKVLECCGHFRAVAALETPGRRLPTSSVGSSNCSLNPASIPSKLPSTQQLSRLLSRAFGRNTLRMSVAMWQFRQAHVRGTDQIRQHRRTMLDRVLTIRQQR